MIKKLLIFLIMYQSTYYSLGQRRCATTTVDSMIRQAHPELGTIDEFESWMQNKIVEQINSKNKTEVAYTIPVIVHVIHNGQAVGIGMNISDAQIQSQIDVLNEDFRKLNAEIADLSKAPYNQTNWASVAADFQINFCLAEVDPNNNVMSTPGIQRINRNDKGFDAPGYDITYIESVIKPSTIWDPNKYLNIWVLSFSDDVLGYATYPINSTLSDLNGSFTGNIGNDGIVIRYNCFGRVGTLNTSFNKGKTAVHELGHWLGLRHIWGDATCGNDYCNDTPTQETSNTGCPDFPHISCSNGTSGDMFVNFMDYSDDDCLILFTNDQKTRIQTVMANSPLRVSLTSQSNCAPLLVEQFEHENLEIFPNPSDGKVNIKMPGESNKKIRALVLNILGETVSEVTIDSSSELLELDYSNEKAGTYFVKFIVNERVFVNKVIISR